MKKILLGMFVLASFFAVKKLLLEKENPEDSEKIISESTSNSKAPSQVAKSAPVEVSAPTIPNRDPSPETSSPALSSPSSENSRFDNAKENQAGSDQPRPALARSQPESLEEIADKKLKIPIKDELKKAKAFEFWDRRETLFWGHYQGSFPFQGQNYLVRINLAGTQAAGVSPRTCILMQSSEKVIFDEMNEDGKLTFLNTQDPKYFILNVLNQYYFQVFRTMTDSRRAFRTHVTLPGQTVPIVFTLNEVDNPDIDEGCHDIHPI